MTLGAAVRIVLVTCAAAMVTATATACGSGGGARTSGGDTLPSTGLVARFEPPSHAIASTTHAELAYSIENRGASPVTIDLDMLGSAIFALEVHHAAGAAVLTIPPGMPPADYTPRTEALAPGGRHRFVLDLNVYSPPLPAGEYTARVRGTGIASETLHFTVSPGGP